jgi:hypothetical protein
VFLTAGPFLKEAQCEIFDLFDFRHFFTIKPRWVGDFGAEIKKFKILVVGPDNSYFIGENLNWRMR